MLPLREFVASFFDRGWRGLQHDGGGPGRETFAGHAAALENALFFRAQLLELDVQHLLKRFRDAGVYILKRCRESPSSLILSDQTFCHDVSNNLDHEQSVPTGILVNQVRKTCGKTAFRKLFSQILCNVRLVQTFDGNLMAQMVDHQIVF